MEGGMEGGKERRKISCDTHTIKYYLAIRKDEIIQIDMDHGRGSW